MNKDTILTFRAFALICFIVALALWFFVSWWATYIPLIPFVAVVYYMRKKSKRKEQVYERRRLGSRER